MWEKHQTADGAVYYQDVAQGLVQWNVPDDYESKGDAKGTELDEEEFAEFSEYTMEDEFLFELQSLGMFTKQRDANLSSSSVWQEALPKIAFLKEKLEEGVGTDGDWEIAMSTNNFALVHYLTRLLDERVDVGVSSMAMQCLAFVGTLYPKVWVDFVHDEHHLHCLFQSVAFLTTKLIMLASTKKIAKSSSSPYLGFDERDIADFNLEGFEREEVVDETTHGVSGMEGHDDQDTSILVCLMLFSQYFGREISLLKCTIDTSTTTPEDIESMCRLSEEDVKGELSAFCASGISSGKNIKVLCRALLLILPSLTEDAYLLAIKAIASLNRQSPVFDALQSTEIAKMCTVSHFDSNNGVNISEGLMHIINDIGFPDHQVPEALPLLRLCTDLANLVESEGFFYTNDVRVIIDVILRELYNLPFTCDTETDLHCLEELRVSYTKFARALIAHDAWKSYNCTELRDVLQFVVSETNNCADWESELLCWSRETAEEALAALETVF